MDEQSTEGVTDKIYIYESPDGGKTVYRREFGKPHETRELISTQDQ